MSQNPEVRRYFTTYTGVKLPFKLVNPLDAREVENRNTYFLGYFDAEDRLSGFDKVVYGEIELAHRYRALGEPAAASASQRQTPEPASPRAARRGCGSGE